MDSYFPRSDQATGCLATTAVRGVRVCTFALVAGFSILAIQPTMAAPKSLEVLNALEPGLPSGAGVQPILIEGNVTCSDLSAGTEEFKINDPGDGTFMQDGISVDIDVRSTGLGTVFDWELSGGVVDGIAVKGGPNTNFYDYAPPDLSADTGLHSPINSNNGRYYGLSHISFCYTPGNPSIDVTKSCTEQSVDNDVVTTVNTVSIHNDGDFTLSNVQLKETIASLTCSITEVDSIAVGPTPLPTNVWVTVPSAGSYGGTLAVGESVDVQVSCYNGELNLANTVMARGESGFGNPEDTASNNPSAECPFAPNPMVDIQKDCDRTRLQQETLLSGMTALVVEVCPTITVVNTSATEPLSSVIVTDPLVPELALGVEIGPLAPLASVDLATALGELNLCYQPTAAEQSPIDESEGVKYDTFGATFMNSASVEATGLFGGIANDSDPAQCPLCYTPD